MNSTLNPNKLSTHETKLMAQVQGLRAENQGLAPLLQMLTEPSWVVRRSVVEAVAGFGDAAVQALVRILKFERDSEARLAAAVDALVMTHASVETAMTELAAEADPAIVADAVQVLGRRRNPVSTPILIELTRHVDDNVAVGAIEALGRLGGRAAVEALIATVRSNNFFRTYPAIDILGRSGDPRVVEPLTALLSNSTYLPEAVRALGRSGDRGAALPLSGLLKSRSDSVVRNAALALQDLRKRYVDKTGVSPAYIDGVIKAQVSSESVARLGRLLSDSEISEAVAVCCILGIIGSIESAEFLAKALHASPLLAQEAARALSGSDDRSDEKLIEAILDGNSSRRKALLPLIKGPGAASTVALCLKDPDAEVRATTCDVLARLGNGEIVSQLFLSLEDRDTRVVHAAVAAIQALGTVEARRLAAHAAGSGNAVVKRSALRILGYFGDESSLGVLVAALDDQDVRVRETAIQGLSSLDSADAIKVLVGLYRSGEARTRAMTVRSMGQLINATEEVFAVLVPALADEDAWVRYYSSQALGRLDHIAAIPLLSRLLSDEAGQVRVAAVEALSRLNSTEAHDALRRAFDSEDVDVRRAALIGLGMAHRPEDFARVETASRTSDMPTRLIALSALANFESTEVLGKLSEAGHDTNEQVRNAAIGLLALRPEPEATLALAQLMVDESTRTSSEIALARPNKGRVSGLLQALQSTGDDQAPALISILSKMSEPDSSQAILAAFRIDNPAARKAAAVVLGSRSDRSMIAALQEASVHDPDPEVRAVSELSLRS